MASRLNLHEEFRKLLQSNFVYFDPPETVKMGYPCIRYVKGSPDIRRANNRLYKGTEQYTVTVIDKDPDSTIADKLLEHFQMCRIDRRYKADGLNHTVLTIYY